MKLFKKKEKLQEHPLEYWEEQSFMLAIPDKDYKWSRTDIINKISEIPNVKVEDNYFYNETQTLKVNLKYDDKEYEIGIYQRKFTMPDIYINSSFQLSNEEIEELKNATQVITIFMKFTDDIKKSFHLQLKIAVNIVPNLIGLIDESAEKLIPAKWAQLASSSQVTPGPNDIYSVHAVYNKSGEVWLHTHGLCRCGLTELEILKSNQENYKNHCDLINAFACFIIDKNKTFNPQEGSAHIGLLPNNKQIIVTCKSWVEAINKYNHLNLGGINDRKNGHNTKTSPIFIYKSKEDINNKLSYVTEYDELWGDNPIFFLSNEETDRMKMLARERFNYVKKASKDKNNEILIKVGLKTTKENESEHIWFELIEFKGNKFKAKLTQEPYLVDNIKVGDEKWFTIDDVTDWIIYTPKMEIKPNNVYLL